jgi:hypothetical protein
MKIKIKNCYELLIESETHLINRGFKIEPTILLFCKCGKINYFGEPICYGCGKPLR